jgi:hypothetical protein
MKDHTTRRSLRGAVYTRVSTEQGLEQDFNSLDAQREACEAYIKSQAHEGCASKPLHRPLPSSKRLMRILRPIVEAATDLVPIGGANFFHHRGIGTKPVGDDVARSPVSSYLKTRAVSKALTADTELSPRKTARADNEPRRRSKRPSRPTAAAASSGNVVLFCGGGNHVDLRGLPGGAEGIRTDGHRGRGEISSWIAAWGFARPLKATLGGGLVFRSAASRFRREHRHPEASTPRRAPLDPLENTSRKYRSFADDSPNASCRRSGYGRKAPGVVIHSRRSTGPKSTYLAQLRETGAGQLQPAPDCGGRVPPCQKRQVGPDFARNPSASVRGCASNCKRGAE